jgi:hypothetical protein
MKIRKSVGDSTPRINRTKRATGTAICTKRLATFHNLPPKHMRQSLRASSARLFGLSPADRHVGTSASR